MNDTTSSTHTHVKVLFEIQDENGIELESLWAIPESHGYKIDNIPFYAREVASNDVVAAEPEHDGMLRFTRLVKASGHSTIRLWFGDATQVASVRDTLRNLGCASELNGERLVAVDVPPTVSYQRIRSYLDQQEAGGILEYEEACLGQSRETL